MAEERLIFGEKFEQGGDKDGNADALDRKASDAFRWLYRPQRPGPAVFSPVSGADLRGRVYVGRYCATTNEQEIQEGLSIVQRQLSERTVRAGNEALIHSIAKEKGQVEDHRHHLGAP